MKAILSVIILLVGSVSLGNDLEAAIGQMESVQIETLEDGRQILADSDIGFTLYTFDADANGVSNCFDQCLSVWPVKVVDPADVVAPFSVHVRDDGTNQLVLDDSPLYFFARDRSPGDTNGDGVSGVWHLIEVQ